MDKVFFELIRVAIGNLVCLSHTPTADEWGRLYEIAKKQSLVGVCFAGMQKLVSQQQTPPEHLYLQWMGMAAKIQQRNEVLNKQCAELAESLKLKGYRSCILKGQSLAPYYGDLAALRQSGDIDVWMIPCEGASYYDNFKTVMAYAKTVGKIEDFNKQHVSVPFFKDTSTGSGGPTEVELHFMPSRMNCPWHNRRLQIWFIDMGSSLVSAQEPVGFNVPSIEFNLVYLLQHCYNHLLFEGVGLRQIMDYYFVLRTQISDSRLRINDDLHHTLDSLGLLNFAGAMMWVLHEVFRVEEKYMIVEPNEKEGKFLLNEIMTGGNFGKYGNDGVMDGHNNGNVAFFLARMRRNMRFLAHYPSEILWSPYAMLSHWIWKRTFKY